MNKKGQTDYQFILIIIIIITWGILYSSIRATNPYTTFMDDCIELFEDDFTFNTTCERRDWNDRSNIIEYECEEINKDELEKYCQNKYTNTEQN